MNIVIEYQNPSRIYDIKKANTYQSRFKNAQKLLLAMTQKICDINIITFLFS